jgi:pimeloyl-ACP methyl ester carboxylesterase
MRSIVAVHGNGGGGQRFELLADHLPADVALAAPTLPGFGGRPLGAVDSLDGLADDLGATVAATPRPRILLGHGIGGSVALQLLARDPDLVDGLILHAPVGTRLDTRWFPKVMASPRVRDAAQATISSPTLRPVLRRLLLRGVERPVAERFLAAYADAEAFGLMFEWLDAAWFDALPVQADLPTIVLWGERDRVLDADQRGDYARLLPRAREVSVPGWGHFPMLDRPEAYARMLVELTRGLVPADDHP